MGGIDGAICGGIVDAMGGIGGAICGGICHGMVFILGSFIFTLGSVPGVGVASVVG